MEDCSTLGGRKQMAGRASRYLTGCNRLKCRQW